MLRYDPQLCMCVTPAPWSVLGKAPRVPTLDQARSHVVGSQYIHPHHLESCRPHYINTITTYHGGSSKHGILHAQTRRMRTDIWFAIALLQGCIAPCWTPCWLARGCWFHFYDDFSTSDVCHLDGLSSVKKIGFICWNLVLWLRIFNFILVPFLFVSSRRLSSGIAHWVFVVKSVHDKGHRVITMITC